MLELSSLDGATGVTIPGIVPFGFFGSGTAGLGDMNGDGVDDIAVTAFQADTSYVLFGGVSASFVVGEGLRF